MGASDLHEERKAMKRKGKEKANNTVVGFFTRHYKEFSINNTEKTQIFKDLVTLAGKKATEVTYIVRIKG